mgnify:FL=1|jgi:hypothetical protein
MGVAISTPNNIKSPNGNSLAVFKKPLEDNFSIKDINGIVEDLKVLPNPNSFNDNGSIVRFTSFSQPFIDATSTPLIEFDFSTLIEKYKESTPNCQFTGTIFCTQSACADSPSDDAGTSNYLRISFNLLVQVNQIGELKYLFSVSEVPASQEPTAQAINSLVLFSFFDEATITDVNGNAISQNTFSSISTLVFNTKTNITGTSESTSVKNNNGWVEINQTSSGSTNGNSASDYSESVDVKIIGNNLNPS